MAFINEYISDEDRKKFNIDDFDKRFFVGGTKSRSWTVDKEKNIYLRNVARGREEFASESKWVLSWGGQLVFLDLKNISTSGVAGGDRHGHKKVLKINIPDTLEEQREQILKDLQEAFVAYKDGGVFATAKNYTLTLDV